MSPITFIILWPLVAALLIGFVPRENRSTIRMIAIAGTFFSLFIALGLFFQFDTGEAGYQFVQREPWVGALDISYYVGVDGINLGLIVMAALVGFAACCLAYDVTERQKEYYILLLIMIGGIIGAFASLDLFFFYFFHELALVPTFIMIGVWGRGEKKNYATFQITIYLSLGALIALIGLVALYVQSGAETFDLVKIIESTASDPFSTSFQKVVFPLLLFGFGILVSLWPFHTWAPLGYGAAPTATAMVHAGVLKKFGLYGLIRIALPLFPEGARHWLGVIAILCLGNILYCGWVAMRQKDLNLLIGNSSVAHMGFVFLGIASLSLVGITGAVFVMVAHGLLAALSFGLSGYLYTQTKDLTMTDFGGLLRQMPFIGTVMVMAFLAGCGVPGFANFPGEIMVLFGAWQTVPVAVIIAAWGALLVGAIYMLRAIRTMLHGPRSEKWTTLVDATSAWRKLPFALLLAGLLFLGCYPPLLTEKIEPSAALVVDRLNGDEKKASADLKEPTLTKDLSTKELSSALSSALAWQERRD